MTRRPAAVRALVAALVSVVALAGLGLGPGVAGADERVDTAPDGSWSLTRGAGPLSVVDRNDFDEQSGTPREVPSVTGVGRSLQFTVPGGGERSEVRPRVPRAVEGTVQEVTYRARLARDFPADADGWQILLQWHQQADQGSPPLAVEVDKGRLLIANNGSNLTEIGRVRAGDTVDLRMRVVFSKDPRTSSVDVWNGGRQVLRGYRPPEATLQADGNNYMKVGLYRTDTLESSGSLTVDALDVVTGTVQAPPAAPAPPPAPPPAPSAPGAPDGPGGGFAWWQGAAVLLALVVAAAAAVVVSRRERS